MNILSITTLFPNVHEPRRGIFIANRLRYIQEMEDVNITVVAPVPYFPGARFIPRFRPYLSVPRKTTWQNLTVFHPRYLSIPGNAFGVQPRLMANSILNNLNAIDVARFDLIDAHYAFPDGVAASIVAKKLNKPYVINVRGSDIHFHAEQTSDKKVISEALSNSQQVIAVSQPLANSVSKLAPKTPVSTLMNGVDPLTFHSMNLARNAGKKCLLSVGNLIELKGHHLVIEAMKLLPEYELLIIGEGVMKEQLVRQIHHASLSDRVSIVNNVSQQALARYYNQADVTVLASSSEGCPNVVIESIACGTPVCATRVGACEDLITENESGVFIEERTPEAIAKAVRTTENLTVSGSEISQKGAFFSWPNVAAAQVEVYRSVLNEGRKE